MARFLATARQRIFAELKVHAFHFEQFAVLLGERVLRLQQNLHQRSLVQLFERRDDRQTGRRTPESGRNRIKS